MWLNCDSLLGLPSAAIEPVLESSVYTVDTNQVATKMTKESKDKAHGEQSSQQTIQDLTKDLMDLTRGDRHKPEHQLFFRLVFLKDRICCKYFGLTLGVQIAKIG